MALLLLAHPNSEHSIANKTIVNTIHQHDASIEIRHLHQLYPHYHIDVQAEQDALLRHDTLILQYPMYWFNMPAILKLWFDEVFTYQFAYGSQGDKLKNKKVIISMTIGQTEENFITDQENLMSSFLKSIEASIDYTQMQLDHTFCLYDVSPLSGHAEFDIQKKAVQQAEKILSAIQLTET